MPTKDVLYMGDSSIETAGSYLSLVLEEAGLSYDYIRSDESVADYHKADNYRLYILSDYPAGMLGPAAMTELAQKVRLGTGLLMIGGWESYQGQTGGYHDSPIAELLPVHISPNDDRVNSADPCCVVRVKDHPIIEELPLDRPPLVAGYNRVVAKNGAEVIMSVVRFSTATSLGEPGAVLFEEVARDPFLVLGSAGLGKTAALTADLAPHWVGGFVDWGDTRVPLVGTGREVEVGNRYLQFARQLLGWLIEP